MINVKGEPEVGDKCISCGKELNEKTRYIEIYESDKKGANKVKKCLGCVCTHHKVDKEIEEEFAKEDTGS